MKLSAPQQCVLRTMYKYDCVIIASWWNSDGEYKCAKVPTTSKPRWNTLNSLLYDRKLLSREWMADDLVYRLTLKGREVAKEL